MLGETIIVGGFCFQPTYEELKPAEHLSRQSAKMSGFQPTYEELKPHPAGAVAGGIWVFSLPMRN